MSKAEDLHPSHRLSFLKAYRHQLQEGSASACEAGHSECSTQLGGPCSVEILNLKNHVPTYSNAEYGRQIKEIVDDIERLVLHRDSLEGPTRHRFFLLLDRFDDTVDQWKRELRHGRL